VKITSDYLCGAQNFEAALEFKKIQILQMMMVMMMMIIIIIIITQKTKLAY
jgi:hypothetical protein